MIKQAVRIAASLLLCSLPSLAQKKARAQRKAPAPAIRFQGAPQYTQEELLAAAGFKPGARLTAAEVKARAKQLNDTGLFAAIKFSSDSKGLLFSLTPASQLYPIHLDNLPLQPGKDLDAKLHARFPLYHGLVPASGSVLDGIRQTFEEMLAAEGVKATVKAALTSGLGPQKITAIDFTITSPAVRIGPIQLSGVSPAMLSKINLLAAGQTGNPFDTENTAIGLQHAFEDLYQDQGYAAVEVSVTQIAPVVDSDQSVAIPLRGRDQRRRNLQARLHRLSSRRAHPPRRRSEDIVKVPRRLRKAARSVSPRRPRRLSCPRLSRVLHRLAPLFNEATHIVNYTLDIAPGPIYQMGTVQFDGAPDAMTARLTRLWKMAPGQPFDESYVSTFAARAQKQDRSLAKWMQTVINSFDVKPDPATHEVNCIFHFAKAAQGGR